MLRIATLALALLAVGSAPAAAAAPTVVLDTDPLAGPVVVADQLGGAVAAWRGVMRVAATGSHRYRGGILARSRTPGGTWGAERLLTTGQEGRAFALAAGVSGDAALVWLRDAPGRTGPRHLGVRITRRRPGGTFGASEAVRSSPGATSLTAAIAGNGTLVAAWLKDAGRKGCGKVVMAAVARRGRAPGAPRRISTSCPNAATPRAALGRDGVGVIAWREGRNLGYARSAYTVAGAIIRGASIGRATTLAGGPAASTPPAVAAGPARASVVWRRATAVSRTGTRGPVVASTVTARGIRAAVPVSRSDRIAGPVDVSASAAGTVAAWEQRASAAPPAVLAARATPGGSFGAPEAAAPCGATDASRVGPHAAITAGGRAVVAFQTACGPALGLSTDYGAGYAIRDDDGSWQAPVGLSTGGYVSELSLAATPTQVLAAFLETGAGHANAAVAVLTP